MEFQPNFCPRDGTSLGDEFKMGKMRRVCPKCGYIFGRDPRVMAGLYVQKEHDLLLVDRTASAGGWSLPLYWCHGQDDPRRVAEIGLAKEVRVSLQAGVAREVLRVRNAQEGPLLVVIFRAPWDHASQHDNASIRFANPHTETLLLSDLTARVLYSSDLFLFGAA